MSELLQSPQVPKDDWLSLTMSYDSVRSSDSKNSAVVQPLSGLPLSKQEKTARLSQRLVLINKASFVPPAEV